MEKNYKMVECTLCHVMKPMNSDHCDVQDRSWEPFYGDYETGVDTDGTVCPDCVQNKLVFNISEGYYFLKLQPREVDTPIVISVDRLYSHNDGEHYLPYEPTSADWEEYAEWCRSWGQDTPPSE